MPMNRVSFVARAGYFIDFSRAILRKSKMKAVA
jgi:hypothetical protein